MTRVAACLLLLVGVLTVTGCGVSTVETTFDDQLISDVGAGSDALKRIETVLADASKANAQFTGSDTDTAMTALMEGRLGDLSADDITRMARTNRQSRGRFRRTLRDLDEVRADITTAQVDPDAQRDLSDGARRFLRAWNDYLAGNAERVGDLRSALAGMQPTFGGFDRLLAAAVDTARLRSTRRFERVRDDFIEDLTARADAFKHKGQQLAGNSAADRRLIDLINDDSEARAIFDEVNRRHPDGYLADLGRESE